MKVGIGSNLHDWDGDSLMTFSNISMKHSCRLEKLCGTLLIDRCCAPKVFERTSSIFASKKSRNPAGRMKVQSQRTSPRDPKGMTCYATASSDSQSCLRFCHPELSILLLELMAHVSKISSPLVAIVRLVSCSILPFQPTGVSTKLTTGSIKPRSILLKSSLNSLHW